MHSGGKSSFSSSISRGSMSITLKSGVGVGVDVGSGVFVGTSVGVDEGDGVWDGTGEDVLAKNVCWVIATAVAISASDCEQAASDSRGNIVRKIRNALISHSLPNLNEQLFSFV